jgi:hypothetical protein
MATPLRRASITSVDSRFLVLLQERQPDPEPVRLTTRLHVGSSRAPTAHWRVVAELLDGHRRLVCLGNTPTDARAAARRAARERDLPPHTVALRMQRWVGTSTAGRWEDER